MPQSPVILVPEHEGFAGFLPDLVREVAALAITMVTAYSCFERSYHETV
jgi:hypothetical protein